MVRRRRTHHTLTRQQEPRQETRERAVRLRWHACRTLLSGCACRGLVESDDGTARSRSDSPSLSRSLLCHTVCCLCRSGEHGVGGGNPPKKAKRASASRDVLALGLCLLCDGTAPGLHHRTHACSCRGMLLCVLSSLCPSACVLCMCSALLACVCDRSLS